MKTKRSVLLSLDGLGVDELVDFLNFVPSLRDHLNVENITHTQSALAPSASSVWAELFTGQPWYSSGCYGYARPDGSLNKLKVVGERDLSAPNSLLQRESSVSKSIVSNVPLLRPNPEQRYWLSDGSLPIKTKVSPSELLESNEFSEYYARPYLDIGRAVGTRTSSAKTVLLVEERRAAAMESLYAQNDWARCIWRLTFFDQLTHLLGRGWLSSDDLICTSDIRKFLSKLNSIIERLLDQGDIQFFLLSAFNQVPCFGRFHLNDQLALGKYLTYDDSGENSRELSLRLTASELVGNKMQSMNLRSSEARLNLSKTIAASPVSGCVFINSEAITAGAPVSKESHAAVCKEVAEYLRTTLVNLSPFVRIDENPVPVNQRATIAPDFIVSVPGIEFSDVRDHGMMSPPRTTHGGNGFFIAPVDAKKSSEPTFAKIGVEVLSDF